MPRKPKCNICEILKYQNFALKEAKHKYQVNRYLQLAQRARNNIIKNWNEIGFCTTAHRDMALDIYKRNQALVEKLKFYSELSRKRIMRELQKAAFKYAEMTILMGVNSIEAMEARMELDRRKHNLRVQRHKSAPKVS